MRRFLVLVLAALLVAGCVGTAMEMHGHSLGRRASFDMRCPMAELHVTEIDPSTAGVEGCGQRATYIFNNAAGTWVLNSPGAEQNQPPFEVPPSDRPVGVPPGSPPGTLPGSLPGAPPGSPPGTLPGAPPGSPPGTPPGTLHH
jgi:hypothetical protein